MSRTAKGTFQVKSTEQSSPVDKVGAKEIRKSFTGEMEGASHVHMLMAMGGEKGSAGYVALEWFTGKIKGRSGRFALQHTGVMDRGKTQLSVRVVPDTGTVELTGITGKMDIKIVDGVHHFNFHYSLPGDDAA